MSRKPGESTHFGPPAAPRGATGSSIFSRESSRRKTESASSLLGSSGRFGLRDDAGCRRQAQRCGNEALYLPIAENISPCLPVACRVQQPNNIPSTSQRTAVTVPSAATFGCPTKERSRFAHIASAARKKARPTMPDAFSHVALAPEPTRAQDLLLQAYRTPPRSHSPLPRQLQPADQGDNNQSQSLNFIKNEKWLGCLNPATLMVEVICRSKEPTV